MKDDTISRQAAIDAVKKHYRAHDNDLLELIAFDIERLPSAQPWRKMGKWIVYYECPKCGEITKDFTEYCPFCDADMRGGQDETD